MRQTQGWRLLSGVSRVPLNFYHFFFFFGQRTQGKLHLSFSNNARRFLRIPPTGANQGLLTTRNPVIWGYLTRIGPGRRRTLSFRILCHRHGAGWHNGLSQGASWSNWQLSGLKGVLLGCRERLQVWNACFQEHWTKCLVAFSAPLVLPEGKGGTPGGSKDTQEQFAIQRLNGRRFLPPLPPQILVRLARGADCNGKKQLSVQW